jgi:hypothetical protein
VTLSIIKAFLFGCLVGAGVLVLTVVLQSAIAIAGASIEISGSGGLWAWSAGFSELSVISAFVGAVAGSVWSYRRQRRRARLATGSRPNRS